MFPNNFENMRSCGFLPKIPRSPSSDPGPRSCCLKLKLGRRSVRLHPHFQNATFKYSTVPTKNVPVTLPLLLEKKSLGTKISMVTAYDYTQALLVSETPVDMILVGDSLGMTTLGHESTVQTTLGEMVIHCRSVARGAAHAKFLVGDLSFGSYEMSDEQAVSSALRLIKEGGVHAVKLEGGRRMASRVRAIVNAGVPVVGHVGLTPQTASSLGGFRVQGARTVSQARAVLDDAFSVQNAGAFQVVLEAVPELVAAHVTEHLSIATIGIGAGPRTSGQVLVYHDMLGMYPHFTPKFCKQYEDVGAVVTRGLTRFHDEVVSGEFPGPEHKFLMKRTVFDEAFPQSQIKSTANKSAKSSEPQSATVKETESSFEPQSATFKETEFSFESQPNAPVVPPSPSARPAPNPSPLKYLVIGGGSLGSLLAARLAIGLRDSGRGSVSLATGFKEHQDRVKAHGMRLSLALDGASSAPQMPNAQPPPSPITGVVPLSPDQVQDGEFDVVIVAVKASSILAAATIAHRCLAPDGSIVTLQNGLGMRSRLLDALLEVDNIAPNTVQRGLAKWTQCVCAGVTSVGATLVGPSVVSQTGFGETHVALPSSPHAQSLVLALAEVLGAGGMPITVMDSQDVDNIVWQKLQVSCAINPLTALLRVTNGGLLENPTAKELMKQAIAEVESVAAAMNKRKSGSQGPYDVVDDEPTPTLLTSIANAAKEGFDRAVLVAQRTANNRSSMLKDIDRNQPTEIEVINGAICALGKKYGVATPINQTLHDLVVALTATNSQIKNKY